MSPEAAALQTALVLLHTPTQVKRIRAAPLPEATHFLLCLAVGEREAVTTAMSYSDRPDHYLKRAAGFFIEQILLAPDADSYRVLGCLAQANIGVIRRNMTLLLRLMHPDLSENSDRSVFAARVTRAWEDIKTPERRASYDDRLKLKILHVSNQQKQFLTTRSSSGSAARKELVREHSFVRRALRFLLQPRKSQ
jgi:hypothetical protein